MEAVAASSRAGHPAPFRHNLARVYIVPGYERPPQVSRITRDAAVCLGLSNFRYDAALGGRVSRDPLKDAELSQGPNLYAYVGNDPVNDTDAMGTKDHKIGDSDVSAQMNKIYSKIESSNVANQSFSEWSADMVGKYDTDWTAPKGDTYTYSGTEYPELNGQTFASNEINYLGVGAAFAARGWSATEANLGIIA